MRTLLPSSKTSALFGVFTVADGVLAEVAAEASTRVKSVIVWVQAAPRTAAEAFERLVRDERIENEQNANDDWQRICNDAGTRELALVEEAANDTEEDQHNQDGRCEKVKV